MRFTIEGRITPYVHTVNKTKHSRRRRVYHASQNAVRVQLKNQMQLADVDRIPNGVPLRIRIDMTVPTGLHKFDSTNVQKALEDAAQTVVFCNDCWVDDIRTTRRLGEDYVTIIDICPLNEEEPK